MPTFENGWICRECWCANRESDSRCYRCHAAQPEMAHLQVDEVAKPSHFEEALGLVEVAEPEAPVAVAPAPTSFCLTCGTPMDADARICSKCGTPAHELGSVVNADESPTHAATFRPGEPLLPRIRAAYNAFIPAHEVEWEEAMSALAVVSALAMLGASRLEGSLAEMLSTFGWLVTLLFVAEYTTRLAAAEDRRRHFFTHLVDLAAIVPLLRPARVVRLVWLLVVGPMAARVSAAMGGARGRLRRHEKAATAPTGFTAAAVATPVAPALRPSAVTPAPVAGVARTPKPVPQLRSHRSFTWLVPAGAAAAASSLLLLVTAEHGQLVTSLLLLVSLGLFSAITATITTLSLDRRARAMSEQPERLPERLRELDQLRDAGLVTPAEHARRAELLRNLAPQ